MFVALAVIFRRDPFRQRNYSLLQTDRDVRDEGLSRASRARERRAPAAKRSADAGVVAGRYDLRRMCCAADVLTGSITAPRGSTKPLAVARALRLSLRRLLPRRLFHALSQAERSHIRPDFLDVGEALGLRAGLAGVVPAERVLAVGGPDRILLLVVDHDLVDGVVFPLVLIHVALR